jgi:peptide/nickel transport system ATP-binding protein
MGGEEKTVVALDNFNLRIDAKPATITTIAGESGSGKTTLANLMLGFIQLTDGQIIYNGRDVTNMNNSQLKEYRRNVQAVFQDPFGVYNPFYRIDHVFKSVNRHFNLSDNATEFRDMVEEGLNVVGLYGEDVLRKYPHQLSGGQRQRIMMARAYMLKPKLIVADEPVSMVDASLRASILDAMLRLRDEHNISFLYITHDLSTAYQIGDQIYMLYQGTTAERGRTMDVIDKPQHPYVQLLIDSVPVPDPQEKWDVDISLPSEEEMRTEAATGCRYYPRCPHRMDKCLQARPPLFQMDEDSHEASCYLYEDRPVAPEPEPLELIDDPAFGQAQQSGNQRRWVAAIAVILLAGAALTLLSSGNQDDVTDVVTTEEPTVESVATEEPTAVAQDTSENTDTSTDDALPFVLTPDDAIEQGALELDTPVTIELDDSEDKHSYTFEGTAGQTVSFQLSAPGITGLAPYGFIFDANGDVVTTIGNVSGSATQRYSVEHTLEADGTYTIVVGANGRSGVKKYTLTAEQVETETDTSSDAEASDTSADDALPFVLTPDDAIEQGARELDTPVTIELDDSEDKHSYTFDGTGGQTISFKLSAPGITGLAPYGFIFDPDGALITAIGDISGSATQRYSIEQTLEADGTYTIIVGANGRSGVKKYTIVTEAVEAE